MTRVITILVLTFLLSFGQSKAASVNGNVPNIEMVTNSNSPMSQEPKLVIYPNPATTVSTIAIESKDIKLAQVAVYSLLGNAIYTKTLKDPTEKLELNVQSFKKGKYIVRVSLTDGSTIVKTLIKQ